VRRQGASPRRRRLVVHSRQDPEEVVTALNLMSGEVIWRQNYAASFQKNQYAVKMAKGPNATPLVAGNRLSILGATGVLTAWGVNDGKKIWQVDFSSTIDTSKLFCGTAASPLMVANLVVVQVGSDVHGGRLVAFNPATGVIKWEWQGPGPGYASPIVVDSKGRMQIVTLTNSSMVGIDAKTGKGLWSIPFADEWHENIVTPLWTGTHLIISGFRLSTHGYLLQELAGKWEAREAWSNPMLRCT
jgi:outer membrane protein assembly factor BamB